MLGHNKLVNEAYFTLVTNTFTLLEEIVSSWYQQEWLKEGKKAPFFTQIRISVQIIRKSEILKENHKIRTSELVCKVASLMLLSQHLISKLIADSILCKWQITIFIHFQSNMHFPFMKKFEQKWNLTDCNLGACLHFDTILHFFLLVFAS